MNASIRHPVTLESERLFLKGVNPVFIHKLISSVSKEEFLTALGLDENEYPHYLHMHEKGMETFRISVFSFILVDKDSGAIIGDAGFHTWNATHGRAELFYNMKREDFREKGLMKEALKKVIAYGFTEMKLNRIAGLAAPWNEASIRLLKGNGFTYEGTMREDYLVEGEYTDSVCYSLLKREWIENRG